MVACFSRENRSSKLVLQSFHIFKNDAGVIDFSISDFFKINLNRFVKILLLAKPKDFRLMDLPGF